MRRASYREKGKSGATFKILSYFPNTDETWSKGPATTAAKRRRRRTSPLPQAPGPGVPTACSSQGRPRPRCHHLLPPSERSCPIWLWMPYAPVSQGSSLLLRRNRDLGRSSSVVTCHRSAATDREAGGVCRALITCRCLALQRRPAGGSPAVVRSPHGVDLQRREGSPCGCGGEALQVHPHAWLSWPPSHRVTFPSLEEEFSHRLTQQGSLSQRGEVSTAPLPERLRNAMQNENALLSRSWGSCIVACNSHLGCRTGLARNK